MRGGRHGPTRPVHRARWTTLERDLRRAGAQLIVGVDEVGRGSLAGPVVACAVVMSPDARAIPGVDDSKVLPPAERRRLARLIRERALALALGAASATEVDRLNIYHASALAMRRALRRLPLVPDRILVDGRPIRSLGVPHDAVIDGDDKCFTIACASIVAKVTRDRLMMQLARRHPPYAWERNSGYATRAHVEGLLAHGPSVHHRRSFIARAMQLRLDGLDPEHVEPALDALLPDSAVDLAVQEVQEMISRDGGDDADARNWSHDHLRTSREITP